MNILIMNDNNIVAVYENNNLEIIDSQRLPIYLLRTCNVENWLSMRAVDKHRANSRLLKKALKLKEKDDINTVVHVNAVTITDSYWVKPIGSLFKYEDVRFDNDLFSDVALLGDYDSLNKAVNSKQNKSPELTNIGSFEKCWKLHNGKWWLYKRANQFEMYSELFAYKLGLSLGMNMAIYEKYDNACIRTRDFTDNAHVNFEPAYSFMGEEEDYIKTIIELEKLSPKLVPDYVKMIFLDTIIANPDRHTFNFGVLRGKDGEILGIAPNFDNNMALIARGIPKNIERKNDFLVKLFNGLISYNKDFVNYIPVVSENIISEIITEQKIDSKDKSAIIPFVMNAYNQINI
ncbi:hypothetical protein FACS189465_3500 [Clostridia bacterium]|nr:hypothetical protein FACS189465_3500 [Clostridia bacterium]